MLQSTNDPAVPLAAARFLADTIPHAELEVLAVEGHFPHVVAPDVVIDAIDRFLDRGRRHVNAALARALARVVQHVGADGGVLVRVDATGHVMVAASTMRDVGVGDEWPAAPELTDDGLVDMQLVTDRSAVAAMLPVQARLAFDRPVTGVLMIPLPESRTRLLLVFCSELPADRSLPGVDSEALQTFISVAPLLEAHARAQASTARLEAVVGALEHAVLVAGDAGGIAEANAAAAALLGIPIGQVHAEVAADALHALRARSTHADELEVRAASLIADPNAVIRDWVWSFDGTPSHLRVSSAPIAGNAGRVWVFADITAEMVLLEAEQRAKAALADSELRYRMILENASDIVFQTIEGMLQWISPNVESALGFTPTELVGHATTHVWHPDDREAAVDIRNRAYAGEAARSVLRIIAKDGRVLAMEVALRPYAEPDGRRGAIGLMHDVSARVAAEDAARESEQQAREANLAKTTFLSRMSHELRTPLNAVIGFAQLLELDDLTDTQRESLGHIRAGGKHLLDLINEILDISRIEVGQLPMSFEPVDIRETCATAMDLVRPSAQAAGIELDALPSVDGDLFVLGDRQRVVQVLLNLLSNAVKYNRPGGSVCVTWERREGTTAISVHDTGRGLSSDALQLLFQPFERLGAETTGVEGTGIGLALSQALARAMDGTIEVESTVGVGSVFSLVLGTSNPVLTFPLDEPESPASSNGRPTDVLYIEDNPQNIELMRRIVGRRDDATLRVETTGRAGLAAALASPPDLLLLDLQLPDLSGDEVLQRLRDDTGCADVPVVVITADASPGVRSRLLAAGADGFLTKPVDVKEVLRWIDDPR